MCGRGGKRAQHLLRFNIGKSHRIKGCDCSCRLLLLYLLFLFVDWLETRCSTASVLLLQTATTISKGVNRYPTLYTACLGRCYSSRLIPSWSSLPRAQTWTHKRSLPDQRYAPLKPLEQQRVYRQ